MHALTQHTSKLLVVLFVFVLSIPAFSTKATLPIKIRLNPNHPVIPNHPFSITVKASCWYENEGASIDITLPTGVRLIQGALHWQGKLSMGNSYETSILVQIEKTGIQEISGRLTVAGLDSTRYNPKFPFADRFLFYASEDTVVFGSHKATMEKAIADSLYLPAARRQAKRDAEARAYWELNSVYVDTPMVSLALTGPGDFSTSYTPEEMRSKKFNKYDLLSDSITYETLSKYYTPKQVKLIKQYNLMFSPLCDDYVEKRTLKKVIDHYNKDPQYQLSIQSTLIRKKHLTELYDLDQRIIHTDDFAVRHNLILQRAILLKRHSEEHRAHRDSVYKQLNLKTIYKQHK